MLPPPGKHWQFLPSKLEEFDARGEIFWSANGNPRRKVYLDESEGIGVQDIWMDFRDAHNQNICITGYPTEKNPDLLKRIIEASSNSGDLVLDCYSGSGTTLAVANQLHRRWIGVDNSPEAIKTMLQRFAVGTQPMGDFVSQRLAEYPQKKRRNKIGPMLFDAVEDESEAIPSNADHSPILDFSLLADSQLLPRITDIVANWQLKSAEVSLSMLTEASP
jgi:adenine-specific DNA-methyltransferase